MAEEHDKDKPSLEPPSLFGRKRKKVAAPPEPASAPAPPETAVVPAPIVAPDPEPGPAAAPVPAPVQAPVVDDSPTTILDEPVTVAVGTLEPQDPVAEEPVAPPELPREPREPWLRGRPAAVLAGLLVGVLVVGATAASLRLCTAVKGTSSCGNPGFFLLVAILVVAVLVGAAFLRLAQVPDATSTSFLAVGLMSVFALLFLVGQLFEWWMIIVIPLVSVVTFLLSHWVTTTYIEPARD